VPNRLYDGLGLADVARRVSEMRRAANYAPEGQHLANGFPSLELERVAQSNGLRPEANRAVVVFTREQRALRYVRARLWAERVERFVARASVVRRSQWKWRW
jgi:hypothetical protein